MRRVIQELLYEYEGNVTPVLSTRFWQPMRRVKRSADLGCCLCRHTHEILLTPNLLVLMVGRRDFSRAKNSDVYFIYIVHSLCYMPHGCSGVKNEIS